MTGFSTVTMMSSTTPPRLGGALANVIELTSGIGHSALPRAVLRDLFDRPDDHPTIRLHIVRHAPSTLPGFSHSPTLDPLPLSLVRQLADTEFWTISKVKASSAWSATHGIPKSTFQFAGLSSSPHSLKAINAATVKASAMAVVVEPTKLHRVLAQAPCPEILFPLVVSSVQSNAGNSRTLEDLFSISMLVIDIVTDVVAVPLQSLKHHLQVPRPHTLGGPLPIIDTPAYSSYPSGHATLASALSRVFAHLVNANPAERKILARLAAIIGNHRIHAGIHSDVDTQGGNDLGGYIGDCMVKAAGDATAFPTWHAVMERARAEFA